MRITKRRMLGVLGSFLLLSLCLVLAIINLNSYKVASAEGTDESEKFIVTEGIIVDATYSFIPLNDNECSVSISNPDEATRAIIPLTATINEKEYNVTEVADDGFMDSCKLIRVKLPTSIRKIGDSAFSYCPELNRISLGNVVEIGDSAFYKCPKLSELIIPKSTEIIGSNILRNNNTQVKVRADSTGEGWSSSWNNRNTNQNVEFNTQIEEKIELEAIYNNMARSGEGSLIGYTVASGQPRTDGFYLKNVSSVDDPIYVENKDSNIVIPEFYNGVQIICIEEYAFEDCTFDNLNLNQYVFLRNDAAQYIGHWFNKQITDENGQLTWTKVQLTDVVVKDEYTTSWSPVTFSHLCYYVNGMLSMPGATEGLINIFEVDAETMSYNQEALAADVEQYGLFTYEEFAEILPVSQEVFEAFNGQYLKVSIGKGLIDIETLAELIERYSEYFVN